MSLWIKFTERFPNANLSKFIKSYDNGQYHMGNGNSKDVFYHYNTGTLYLRCSEMAYTAR